MVLPCLYSVQEEVIQLVPVWNCSLLHSTPTPSWPWSRKERWGVETMAVYSGLQGQDGAGLPQDLASSLARPLPQGIEEGEGCRSVARETPFPVSSQHLVSS